MALHDVYAANINGTVVGGVSAQSIRTGSQTRGETSDGALYPNIRSLVGQRPGFRFSTMAVAAALGESGLLGLAVTALSLYAQRHQEGGTRATGSAHRQYLMQKGILVPRTLVCDHQDDAVITYEALAEYDGVNDPIVPNDSVSLPADPVETERFALGPATVAGVTIASKRRVEIDFGLSVATEGADGDIWDTQASIRAINPTITITGIDLEWFKAANIPLEGKAATHPNTTIYLRKRAPGGTFVADATEEHILLTAAGLATIDTAQEGNSNEPSTASLVIETIFDGINVPLLIDLTSALP